MCSQIIVGFGCATILWHFINQPDEFAATPLSGEQERSVFEKVAVLRKISVGASAERLTAVSDSNSHTSLTSLTKTRSVSQSPLAPFSRPVQHAPWTCVGTVADFLVAGLASLQRPVMSPQMAMSWGYFNIMNNTWDLQALVSFFYTNIRNKPIFSLLDLW